MADESAPSDEAASALSSGHQAHDPEEISCEQGLLGVDVDAKDGMRLAEVLRRHRRGVLGVERRGGARGDGCGRQRSERLQPRILWAFVFDVLLDAQCLVCIVIKVNEHGLSGLRPRLES
eukprot:jgi/Tetstr1/455355/TSEL_042190.t1